MEKSRIFQTREDKSLLASQRSATHTGTCTPASETFTLLTLLLHKQELTNTEEKLGGFTHVHKLHIGFWSRRLVQDLYSYWDLHCLPFRHPYALGKYTNSLSK